MSKTEKYCNYVFNFGKTECLRKAEKNGMCYFHSAVIKQADKLLLAKDSIKERNRELSKIKGFTTQFYY